MATRQLTVVTVDSQNGDHISNASIESAIWFPSIKDVTRYNKFLAMPFSNRYRVHGATGFPVNPGISLVYSEERLLSGGEKIDTLAVLYRELVLPKAGYLKRVFSIDVL